MDVIGQIPFNIELSDVWNGSQKEIAHFEELMNALNREFEYYGEEDGPDFLKFIDERSDSLVQQLIKKNIAVTSSLAGMDYYVPQIFDLEATLRKVKLEYENPGISEGHEKLTPQEGLVGCQASIGHETQMA